MPLATQLGPRGLAKAIFDGFDYAFPGFTPSLKFTAVDAAVDAAGAPRRFDAYNGGGALLPAAEVGKSTYKYPAGVSLTVTALQNGDAVLYLCTLVNASPLTLLNFEACFGQLKFPPGTTQIRTTHFEGPAYVEHSLPSGKPVWIADPNPYSALRLRFGQTAPAVYSMWADGGDDADYPPQPGEARPWQPIQPGEIRAWTIAVCFTEAASEPIRARIRARWPMILPQAARDNSPIGEWEMTGVVSTVNPWGYHASYGHDYVTEPTADEIAQGKPTAAQRFRIDSMAQTANVIANVKGVGGKRVLIWDVEGMQHFTYVGTPMAGYIPPIMLAELPAILAALRAGGVEPGFTLRPLFSGRPPYGETIFREQVGTYDSLASRIEYCISKWGVKLFYVDSDWDITGETYRKLVKAYPTVTLLAEFTRSLVHYSAVVAYDELREGITSTPAWVRRIYPEAKTAVMLEGYTADKKPALAAAVKQGDLMLAGGTWYGGPSAVVKDIYR